MPVTDFNDQNGILIINAIVKKITSYSTIANTVEGVKLSEN